jgi:thiosulfate/3-mercaptopyruvate sulfurtransferase
MTRRGLIWSVMLLILMAAPFLSSARTVDPIVSTEWVEKSLTNPKLVVVDIRKVEEYKAGHIPNAVNVIYGSWAGMKGGLRNETPPTDDLFDVIGAAGIGADSIVVVVGKTDTMSDRSDTTRVAWTLKYGGIENVAVLDGGYNKWVADKKAVSTDVVKAKTKSYQGKTNEGLFVKKEYVLSTLGKVVLVDTREPDFFLGKKKLDFVARTGRIRGAVNLPSVEAYTKDGVFKDKGALLNLAVGAVGKDTSKEIIVYCDTGKLASVWAFIMTELYGYKNVKIYDGSSEDWMKDPKMPVEP